MKSPWTLAAFRAISILLIITDAISCLDNVPSHCHVTRLTGPENLSIRRINGTSLKEPFQDYSWIDICMDLKDLRINWTMTRTMPKGSDVKLCYEVKSVRKMKSLLKQCFMLHIPHMYGRQTQLFCWFKIEHFREKPYIEALATYVMDDTPHYFYGDVNVVFKDNCTDVCVLTTVHFRTVLIGCDSTNLIWHDRDVSIEQLKFEAENSTMCQNILLNYSTKNEREIEFSVNCAYNGLGKICFMYTIRGIYCHKCMKVRVSCEKGTMTSTQPGPTETKHREDTFWIMVSLIVVFTISISSIVCFVLRRCHPRSAIREGPSRRFHPGGRHQQGRRRYEQEINGFERNILNRNLGDTEEDIS